MMFSCCSFPPNDFCQLMICNELMTTTQILDPRDPLLYYYVYKYMSSVLLDKLALAHKPNFVESSKLVWV